MADATTYSFDLTPPFRSSLAALGGAAKQDDAAFPPNPVTMPTAVNWNHFARAIEAFAKMAEFITFEVRFFLGIPQITAVISLRSTLEVASFASPVDNGDGDTTISWAPIANQFPPANRPPEVVLIGDGEFLYPTADTTVPNTVRVRTRDRTNALVDVPFLLKVWGK